MTLACGRRLPVLLPGQTYSLKVEIVSTDRLLIEVEIVIFFGYFIFVVGYGIVACVQEISAREYLSKVTRKEGGNHFFPSIQML